MAESLQFKRAGAFLGGHNFKLNAPALLRELGVETLEVRMHKDCGALKLVHSVTSESNRIDKQTYLALVPPFLRRMRDPAAATMERIEGIGRSIQRDIAMQWIGASTLKRVFCETNFSSGKVEGNRTLLLTVPIIEWAPTNTAVVTCMDPRCKTRGNGFDKLAESLGLNPDTTYTITIVKGPAIQAAVDPVAAVRYIGIRKVVLFAGKNDRDHVIDDFHMAIRRREVFLPNADVERYD